MEAYRSGHNENDSKSFWRDERHVGSNPTASATYKPVLCRSIGQAFPLPIQNSGNAAGLNLCRHIKVGVNIRRCAECGMPQPYLNLLHRHTIG